MVYPEVYQLVNAHQHANKDTLLPSMIHSQTFIEHSTCVGNNNVGKRMVHSYAPLQQVDQTTQQQNNHPTKHKKILDPGNKGDKFAKKKTEEA